MDRPFIRTPTVDEALPFSPLTSIVPFSPDVVPFLAAGPPTPSSIFKNEAERRSASRGLDSLNTDIQTTTTSPTPLRLQQTLQHLRNLLEADELTQYKFKKPDRGTGGQSQIPPQRSSTSVNGGHSSRPQLSPFAEMVLQNIDVSYRCEAPFQRTNQPSSINRRPDPSPVSPTSKPKAAPPPAKPRSRPEKPAKKQLVAENPPTPNRNAQVEVQIQIPQPVKNQFVLENGAAINRNAQVQVQTPSLTPPSVSRNGTAVIVSSLPPSSRREEYQSFPDIDARVMSGGDPMSRKRKREEADNDDLALRLSVDQQEKADAALHGLQTLTAQIFEAEDQIHQSFEAQYSTIAPEYFVPESSSDAGGLILNPAIHAKLLSLLNKAVSSGRFSRVAVDDVARLQKLEANAAHGVENTALSFGQDWSEDDLQEWGSRIESANNGLNGARVLLRTMTAGREEKQLYAEDHVQAVLNGIKHVFDMALIPTVECRSSDSASSMFAASSKFRKELTRLMVTAGKLLSLLGDLLVKVDVAESVVTTVEYLAVGLIFVENAATEKESALGVQTFETARRKAMDVLARIFSRYSEQRSTIISEILSSLEKLPVTRQSARQYKMPDCKPIQLVSALLMRLIQTSATRSLKGKKKVDDEEEGHDDDGSGSDTEMSQDSPLKAKHGHDNPAEQESDPIQKLHFLADPLHDLAQKNASYLIGFMVQRALTSTKTGDQPYRNLLDIFTEDFLSVLGSPDWPAAELLLRALLSRLIHIHDDSKSPAPARTMALDVMGTMGSGISDLKLSVRQSARALDASESELSARISEWAETVLEGSANESKLLKFEGPFRVVLEYLQDRGADDPQLQSARGYLLSQWAKMLLAYFDTKFQDEEVPSKSQRLSRNLVSMISDASWLEARYEFDTVSTPQARIAAGLLALSMQFCKAQTRIFDILLKSMSSEHATVRSRSLKSVDQLLKKEPALLDRDFVIKHILRATNDSSPLVRDSALRLLGECLSLRPKLDTIVFDKIITRVADATTGVRKLAMTKLKDIYLRNDDVNMRSAIAEALLQRIRDMDQGVSDMARQTIEDVWIAPFRKVAADHTEGAQSKVALQDQVRLIVRTAQRGETVLAVLELLLQSILSGQSKESATNFKVCQNMVAVMFDLVLNATEDSKAFIQGLLQTLAVFAKSNPRLVAPAQLQHLEPYIKNLATVEDTRLFRSVIVVFRYVLPSFSRMQEPFLRTVQDSLFKNLSKLGKSELKEVALCLSTIDQVLKNTDRLVKLVLSALDQLQKLKQSNFADAQTTGEPQKMVAKVQKLLMISASFGYACDLDSYAAEPDPCAKLFKEKFPKWKGSQVAGLIIDVTCPYTLSDKPPALKETALDSICYLAEAWPKQYLRADVGNVFERIFKDEDSRLERIALSGFNSFFAVEERRSDTGAQIAVGEGAVNGDKRMDASLAASDNDGVATTIAMRFLSHVIRIAQESTDDLALLATQVIASINRQGLVHPKETGPTLVALETSANTNIAAIAFQEHRALHHKHESMFEKEYMKAVQQAFQYQKHVYNDTLGFTGQPPAAKLRSLYEVLKSGNGKVRKKFLSNLCGRVNFELAKLDTRGDPPVHVLFTRFCVENLALFDYARTDELLHLLACMEKVVTTTGASVAHPIETEILKLQLESEQNGPTEDGINTEIPSENLVKRNIDPSRLHQLTVASMILSMVWETRTFLRKLWNLSKQSSKSNNKPTAKDLNRAPTKQPFVTSEKYLAAISSILSSLASPEDMLNQCRSFAELMSVDNELKVASEDDDEADLAKAAAGYETPDEDDAAQSRSTPGGSGSRRRKRSGSATPATGAAKKRKSKQSGTSSKKARKGSSASADDDAMVWE